MQVFQSSLHDQTSNSPSASVLSQVHSLLTPRRIGYAVAGALVLVGVVALVNGGAVSHGSGPKAQNSSIQTPNGGSGSSAATPHQGLSSSTSPTITNFSTNSTNGNPPDTNLDVNGQDVPVPKNGSTQKTVTNSDGSHTTVNVSGNSSTSGSASNSSSSSFSLDVQSDSSSSGGTSQ